MDLKILWYNDLNDQQKNELILYHNISNIIS
jgi:hypothetical protein